MKNQPAFPRIETVHNSVSIPAQDGMTLLDYFAGQTLIGYTSNQTAIEEIVNLSKKGKGNVVDIIALHCYGFAESMLKEREKRI